MVGKTAPHLWVLHMVTGFAHIVGQTGQPQMEQWLDQGASAQIVGQDIIRMDKTLFHALSPSIERVEDFEIAVVDGKSQQAFGSAAFRHEDTYLIEAYNRELDKLKESGRLLEIFQEFGFTEHELPGNVTAAEALEMW
jgi:hypothetical protein